MIILPTICGSCKHYKYDGKASTCPAFPTGIPEDILVWGGDHRKPTEDQVGDTVHSLQDGKEEQFEDWVFTYILPGPE